MRGKNTIPSEGQDLITRETNGPQKMLDELHFVMVNSAAGKKCEMSSESSKEVDPAEAATVEISQEPLMSLVSFARVARKFGFRIVDTVDDGCVNDRALDMAQQLMPYATDRDRQQFAESLLVNVKPDAHIALGYDQLTKCTKQEIKQWAAKAITDPDSSDSCFLMSFAAHIMWSQFALILQRSGDARALELMAKDEKMLETFFEDAKALITATPRKTI